MKKIKYLIAVSAILLASQGNAFAADSTTNIPYANPGVINPVTYTFTAINTGTVNAYFAGSTASYNEILGLEINGVSTNKWGLLNKQSVIGTQMSWNVTAGDKLTFVNYVWGWNQPKYDSNGNPINGTYTVSSDIAKNSDNNQHVFATELGSASFNQVYNNIHGYNQDLSGLLSQLPSSATAPADGTPPVFVGFEDLLSTQGKRGNSDYNYNDLGFVFTNVEVKSYPTAPEIDTNLAGLGLGLLSSVLLLMFERRRSRSH